MPRNRQQSRKLLRRWLALSLYKKLAPVRGIRGQASIMIAIMLMTFLFFFCFVVNVGMLVNAKIQLQNAADLAAYAGAAVQARQLNRISYLNYEMRRVYKKFLFRYYVIGNMAQKGFPTTSSGNAPSTAYSWSPDGNAANGMGVPAVCIVLSANDNYCQVKTLPGITIPNALPFDTINNALRQQLININQIRADNCSKIALTNLLVLELWLFNGDPNKSLDLSVAGLPGGVGDAQQIVSALVKGLGLIPRELILNARINTLAKYLNQPPQALTLSAVEGMQSGGDPHKNERSIQAFYSAFYTLGNNTFTSNSIELDEIQSPQQINLSPISSKFDTYAIYFDTNTSAPKDAPLPCEPRLVPETVTENVPLGVAKDTKTLTYYAVRLKAKAKLLFNPWGSDGITLTAYAAAQPFGSRIGPNLTGDSWHRNATPNISISTLVQGVPPTVGYVPNLPVSDSDSLDNGWNTTEVLGAMLSAGFPSTGPNKVIGETEIGRAYQVGMAPNLWETTRYNIPNDLDPGYDPTYRFSPGIFDDQRTAWLWAPIAPPDDPGSINSELQSALADLFKNNPDPNAAALQTTLQSQLNDYINSLHSVNLKDCNAQKLSANVDDNDCESFNMVRLTNPLRARPLAADGPTGSLLALPPWLMPQEPKQVLTSWNSPNDPGSTPATTGRLGYSVKFVALNSIGQVPTDSVGTHPVNPPGTSADDETKNDLNVLQH